MRMTYLVTAAAAALGLAQPAAADTVCDWMDLANRLGTSGEFEFVQPNWWQPRTTK